MRTLKARRQSQQRIPSAPFFSGDSMVRQSLVRPLCRRLRVALLRDAGVLDSGGGAGEEDAFHREECEGRRRDDADPRRSLPDGVDRRRNRCAVPRHRVARRLEEAHSGRRTASRRAVEPFYIYKYEVTNEQYKAFIDATGHRAPPALEGEGFPADKGRHPVVEVSWDDAQAYCRWAGTQLADRGPVGIRRPRSRAGGGQTEPGFPVGRCLGSPTVRTTPRCTRARRLQNAEDWKKWYEGDQKSRFPLTSRGGSFPKSVSPFGIHDMAGNAWEWCAEIQAPYPDQKPEDAAGQEASAPAAAGRGPTSRCTSAVPIASPRPTTISISTPGFAACSSSCRMNRSRSSRPGTTSSISCSTRSRSTRKKLPAITAGGGHRGGRSDRPQQNGATPFGRRSQFLARTGVACRRESPSPGSICPISRPPRRRSNRRATRFPTTGPRSSSSTSPSRRPESNDVVLLGYENEKEERQHLVSHVKQLLSDGALIVFFGSDESAGQAAAAVWETGTISSSLRTTFPTAASSTFRAGRRKSAPAGASSIACICGRLRPN